MRVLRHGHYCYFAMTAAISKLLLCAKLEISLDFDGFSTAKGDDLEMGGGVWTFDGFVSQQASTTKKVGIRTLREDWPHGVGAGIFEALQEQAVNEVRPK